MRARQQAKAAVLDYDSGTPESAMQVRVALCPDAAPSFTDVLERAAMILDNDGWAIERVCQRAMLGMDEQGYGFLQVVLSAKRRGKQQGH
jgi:hypothetical protein